MTTKYLISLGRADSTKKATIHDSETKLKVSVIDLLKATFKPKKGEKHYFVTDAKNKVVLAFETEGFQRQHKNLRVLEMVARYCVYLGFVGAQIHSTWP
jgi:hypothetical protein